MEAKVILFSQKNNELNKFLSQFYSKNFNLSSSLSWKHDFSNPIEITDLIAALVDNNDVFKIDMWITLDENVYIKISQSNANNIIKYLFERYPY